MFCHTSDRPNRALFLFMTIVLLSLPLCAARAAFSQTTAFSYSGRLTDANAAATGTFEMRFELFDALTGGSPQPQPGPVTLDFTVANGNPVTVTKGTFTVQLDFSAPAFPADNRFLEVSVRHNSGESFTRLVPRQQILSAPYSVRSISAVLADSALSANTAGNVTGIVQIANGGTGSGIKNFVDLSTDQTVGGVKTFAGTNSDAALVVTNAQAGITNPSPTNLPPAALKGVATSTSNSNIGVMGVGDGTTGIGVMGITNGSGSGGQADAIGVAAFALSTTGTSTGLSAQIMSPDGAAISAQTSATGYIFVGESENTSSPNPKFFITAAGNVGANGAVTAKAFHLNSGNLDIIQNGDLGTIGTVSAGTVDAGNANITGTITTNQLTATQVTTTNANIANNVNTLNVHATGDVSISGSLGVLGSKNSIVKIADGRWVALSAMESPETWFEDFGTIRLRNGRAFVRIDKMFAQTANVDILYKVFLTPNGNTRGLYVIKKTAATFEVRENGGGRSNVTFDYRIVAKRRGYERDRFEQGKNFEKPVK